MQANSQLRYVFQFIPEAVTFQNWCQRRGIRSLASFLEADLLGVPEPFLLPWRQVQVSIREANRVARRRGVAEAIPALDRMLRRRPAQLEVPLRLLSTVVPVGLVSRRAGGGLSARAALEELGGVASARAIAGMLGESHGRKFTVRQVRDRFRNTGGRVRKLGAGYFALDTAGRVPVLHWVETRLLQARAESEDSLVQAILDAYPRGHERSVRGWLHQQPGVLSVHDGMVYLVELPVVVREPA